MHVIDITIDKVGRIFVGTIRRFDGRIVKLSVNGSEKVVAEELADFLARHGGLD